MMAEQVTVTVVAGRKNGPWANSPRPAAGGAVAIGIARSQTLSVGSRPSGASPYGCVDMIGNVMEWTSSRFELYPGNELDPDAGKQTDVVRRGGSWVQEELAPIPTRCAT